ncbi:DUF4198 domain-containing protein [Acinetobacter pragensis]|uniref:DUF4198 domain-containing protein n=1 Tax=Acinetobacter pragensis TaxID=1806892 RepID=A0A151XZY0_9GAMM|nr:DUF4198 domain-containing protein [Acinetobacter pragensis]KYQ71343.1 hypothetical protein AZH43_15090 [Acinetobacter pragensis]
MKKYLVLALLTCSYSQAHEPYIAPLSFSTANTQMTMLSGYAEEALNTEYALKDIQFTVIQPDQSQISIQPQSYLESATLFDLKLPEQGTYTVYGKTSYPIQYAQYDKQWKVFVDAAADKAPALSERDYVIPSDFKGKTPKKINTIREWNIQTYISKETTSAIAATPAPIQVAFQTHPNSIEAGKPVQLQLNKAGKPFAHAEVLIRAQGTTDKQAQTIAVQANGSVTATFPHAGNYLLEISEKPASKTIPKNQHYTIISLGVKTPAAGYIKQ